MTKTKKKPTTAQLRKAFEKATKPSQILAIALRDLRLTERNKRFVVNMNHWMLNLDGRCNVCLAGAVMANRYPNKCKAAGWTSTPEDFKGKDDTPCKLDALDVLRVGNVKTAAAFMGVPTILKSRIMPSYDHSEPGWWKAVRQLLADLREAGE